MARIDDGVDFESARVGQRRVLNHVVETATIITRFERPILGDLVVPAGDVLVLTIRIHARRDRLLRAKVEVFNQRNAGRGVREDWRCYAANEVGSHVGDASRAGATEALEVAVGGRCY